MTKKLWHTVQHNAHNAFTQVIWCNISYSYVYFIKLSHMTPVSMMHEAISIAIKQCHLSADKQYEYNTLWQRLSGKLEAKKWNQIHQIHGRWMRMQNLHTDGSFSHLLCLRSGEKRWLHATRGQCVSEIGSAPCFRNDF